MSSINVLRYKEFFNLASIPLQRPKSHTKWENRFWQLDENVNSAGQFSPMPKTWSDK